ncbi:hypothetical protein B0H14DRAFT_2634841 [Mycena olivaceomarginata]|nr:hypothetical protein B0H14DRAFT_2634841 [Mycena olivaceomarginata]
MAYVPALVPILAPSLLPPRDALATADEEYRAMSLAMLVLGRYMMQCNAIKEKPETRGRWVERAEAGKWKRMSDCRVRRRNASGVLHRVATVRGYDLESARLRESHDLRSPPAK